MESAIMSDDNCDSELKRMKNELIEYGLEEENLSKEEMSDLLKALRNSKSTEKEEEIIRDKAETSACSNSPKNSMKRRYLNVKDRRLPWSLFPVALTQAEKARTLAVYIKIMSINNYRQARQTAEFVAWPPPIQIIEDMPRVQPIRSTRSGRSVPIYADFEDDSSDLDFVITKNKKRKASAEQNGSDGNNSNKVISLKRKPSKDENNRPRKEARMNTESKLDIVSTGNSVKPKKDLFTLIED